MHHERADRREGAGIALHRNELVKAGKGTFIARKSVEGAVDILIGFGVVFAVFFADDVEVGNILESDAHIELRHS